MIDSMITYAPNISWLFAELPFDQRPRAAAELGFRALEFGFHGAANIAAIEAAQQDYGMQVVLFNVDVPVWDTTNKGYLVDPTRRDEFHRRLDDALALAERLKPLKIMLPVGVVVPELSREAQRDCMIENLRYAAPLAEQANVIFTIELLNSHDNPGYFLTSSREAFDVIRAVNHPRVKFQYDTYHLQVMEGHLIQTLTENIDLIGHIQFGDAPGRHEPGYGEINFDNVAKAAERAGYEGYICLEYIPTVPTVETVQRFLPR